MTMQISSEVRKELEKLKIHKREALNEVIQKKKGFVRYLIFGKKVDKHR